MARRKRPKGGEKPETQTAIPFQEAQAPEARQEELRVFPFELHRRDLVNVDGREWEVPVTRRCTARGRWSRSDCRSRATRA
jgi:hypothetical protein